MRSVNGHKLMLQAHRGVSTDCPENTMAAFAEAVKQGYDIIELDPKFTKDDVCVVLHDRNLKRTARGADGYIPENAIADITYAEAYGYEYGSWFGKEFTGEKLPLLEDALVFARENNIPLKIDNVIWSFTDDQLEIIYDLVKKTGMEKLAGFTSANPADFEKVTARFPDAPIHYDGPVSEESIAQVCSCIKNNPLFVWLPYQNRLTSWCKTPPATAERVEMIRRVGGKVGVWILEDEGELIEACEKFAPDVVETTGSLKPDA